MIPTLTVSTVQDLIDVAVSDGRFKTLAAALQAAGLLETLKGAGPFTVFAPTDDAFAKIPSGSLQSLLRPENKQRLTDILLYHAVSGKVMAADVIKLQSAKTVFGKPISIKVAGGKVYLNESIQVIITDIPASNGVIHVIDGVLMPPM
jgi:transforming growth factor-beta-induced protein